MAVNVDVSGLEKLRADFEKINTDKILRSCGDRLMAELLRRVIKGTPVGKRPEIKERFVRVKGKNGKAKSFLSAQAAAWQGYRGGTLRRGWTAAKEDLQYIRYGDTLSIKAVNPTYYGDYVEHGHRQHRGRFVPAIGKKLKRSYVPGLHFVQRAEDRVQAGVDKIVAKETDKAIKEALKDVQ